MALVQLNGVQVQLGGVNVAPGGGASYEAAPLLLGRAIIGRPLIVSSGTLDDGSPVDTIQWYQCDDASKTAEASISGLATYTAETRQTHKASIYSFARPRVERRKIATSSAQSSPILTRPMATILNTLVGSLPISAIPSLTRRGATKLRRRSALTTTPISWGRRPTTSTQRAAATATPGLAKGTLANADQAQPDDERQRRGDQSEDQSRVDLPGRDGD